MMRQYPMRNHWFLVSILLGATCILIAKLVSLHVFESDFLQQQSTDRTQRIQQIPALRGKLLDRNGTALAVSAPVINLWADPQQVDQNDTAALQQVASLASLAFTQIQKRLQLYQKRRFVYLRRQLTPAAAAGIRALDIPGIYLEESFARYFPSGPVTAQLLGIVDVDHRGIEGLELAFNSALTGQQGQRLVQKDRLGRTVRILKTIQPAIAGQDIQLSIDLQLQHKAYSALQKTVDSAGATSGSLLIVHTSGAIIAAANYPSFNPNDRAGFQPALMKNRLSTDVFEPGSLMKAFTVLAALSSNLFTKESLIDTNPGELLVGKKRIQDPRNYGIISLKTLIQHSSNVGATHLALALPRPFLLQHLKQLGFGQVTAAGFPGEVTGWLPKLKKPLDKATLSYGYGIALTLMQVAQAYLLLANDGAFVPIHFEKRAMKVVPPEQRFKADQVQAVRAFLTAVVQEAGGTGRAAQIPGYSVAGKTGTVLLLVDGQYSEDHYAAIFAGIAPASRPAYVLVVAINTLTGEDHSGGRVAAPLFAELMSATLRRFRVPSDQWQRPEQHHDVQNTQSR